MRKTRLPRFRNAVSRGRNIAMDGLDNFLERGDDRMGKSNDVNPIPTDSHASESMSASEINNIRIER